VPAVKPRGFIAPLAAYQAHPEVFATRRRLETMEAALGEIRQLVLVSRDVRRAPPTFTSASNPTAPIPAVR
jgi:hypothetical protein